MKRYESSKYIRVIGEIDSLKKRHGYWEVRYKNDTPYWKGNFIHGDQIGYHIALYPDGNLKYKMYIIQ